MDKTEKSFTISELIKSLKELMKTEGDLEVLIASDEEGNSFGTIGKTSYGADDDGYVIIYPETQFTDF